jgi:xanthine dehydrogenase small subunit
MAVAFVLNGRPVDAGRVGGSVTLLQWLRGRGLTGTKEGCAEGECGACAVAMRRTDAHGRTRYEPINSCLVPLASVHGETVVTVEGVAAGDGALHPVQEAMVQAGGSQCGYCTPGFVVSLFCEYYRPGRDGFDPEAISGNLCRCTGYRPIADVARAMPAPAAGDPHLAALEAPVAPRPRVDTADDRERFVRPLSLAELFDTLAQVPDATLIAGGTDVMVGVTQKGDRPATLVSLAAVPELRGFAIIADTIVLGAGLTLTEIEERLHDAPAAALPLLSQLLPLFSSRLIRNRATLGGNLMTASPIGDAPPVLLALDASVTLASAAGSRVVPLREFFLDYRQTVARPGEVLIDVRVPRAQPAIQRFYKVSKRVLDDISTVAAAFAVDLAADGRVERARIAYGGVAATPIRATTLEQALAGQPWTLETASALRSIADGVGTPMTDLRGSAGYRRAMIGRLLDKCVADTANMAALVEAAQ